MTAPTHPTKNVPPATFRAEAPTALLVTIPQAASLLAVSRSIVYELIWEQELAPVKFGRSVRIRTADLERFVRQPKEARYAELPDSH